MITVTHAKGSDLCTNCGENVATANIAGQLLLCESCANTLLENLKRKEAAENAH